MKGTQKLKLKQESAHEMELTLDTLHNTLEALEEYIGKAGYYSDWDKKRQVYRKTIADSNDTAEGFEDLFLTQLFIVKASVKNKPEFFRKEIQKEFYKWINAVGIDVNNCPDKLKHFLFEINEVLEGRGENIVNQTKELIKDKELNPNEALGFFSQLQNPLNKNRDRGSLLKGKSWNEAENRDKIGGDFEQGQKAFSQISQGFASKHGNFDLFSEQKKVRGIQSNDPQQRTNFEIIQDVKNNPQNWRLDEITTQLSDYYGREKVEEWVLVNNNFARLEDYDQEGKFNFDNNPLYRWESFNAQQRFEIKKALNISGDYSTNDEIKWVVKEVKENPSVWRIKIIQGQNYLIHNSAQVNESEIGTLIHNQQKFSEAEWAEVRTLVINLSVVNDIRQGEFTVWRINFKGDNSSYWEDWYIRNSVDVRNGVKFDPENMYKIKDLNEVEKQEIGYRNLEEKLQLVSSVSVPENKKDDKGIGTGGILAIIGLVSAVVIAGVVVVRKKLNKKVKKISE